tara:strand:- start:3252 stop:3890 length:639 start_codon:yes stop_codon:yes gene_type:complete
MAQAGMTENNDGEQRRVQLVPTKLPILELKIYCENKELKEMYEKHIENHNNKISGLYCDSGFDLLNPTDRIFMPGVLSLKYPLGIKVALNHCSLQKDVKLQSNEVVNLLRVQPHAFMLLPRSSTGLNTNIRLSNSVGVIDSGYRGELTALIDVVATNNAPNNEVTRNKFEKGKRNFQLVSFNGFSMHVNLVEKEEDLGNTERGEGGFGSTGN